MSSMRCLIIEDTPDGLLDLAIRGQACGHDIKYFCRAYDQYKMPVGRGLVDRVPDWRALARRVDLVITGSCGYAMQEIDRLKAEGVPLIGGCQAAAAWETDRLCGMREFARASIPVPPYRQCATIDDALAYVTKRDEGCAIKPCGDVADKSLSFVAKTAKEAIWRLMRWKREHKRFPTGLIVQDLVKGIEFAVGGWIGPGGFAEGFEENAEEKRLFAGNIGPNCYSADTEVLTEAGWKRWPDVGPNDQLAGMDADGRLTFWYPENLIVYEYDGDMLAWRSSRVDLLVTPDHRMYVADRATTRKGQPDFMFLSADEIAGHAVEKKYAVSRVVDWPYDPQIGPSEADARMLGMFLADGYCKKRSVVFGNCPPHKERLIRKAALDCGLVVHRYGSDICINSVTLADRFSIYPKATEKRAPPEIMNAKPSVARAFLDGMALDATTTGNLVYTTASKGMADDLQLMLLRLGYAASVRERDRRGEPDRLLNGYTIKGALSWDVAPSAQALAWLRPRYCRRVPYRGKVYCATVPNHVLFVRRNGKACWSGNCGEAGTVLRLVKTSKIASKVLKPFEDRLVSLGYVGNVDVNCIVDDDGVPWPLEFTCRFGYPAINIEMALHADPIEFLAGLAAGAPPKSRRLNEVAVGVVMALPPYPYREAPDETVGVPVWGVTPGIVDNLHLCMAQAGDGQLQTAGSYVLVSTGTGDSVVEARNTAYRVLDRLTIPASPFYRNDIGGRLRHGLDKLQEHGYATGMQFA